MPTQSVKFYALASAGAVAGNDLRFEIPVWKTGDGDRITSDWTYEQRFPQADHYQVTINGGLQDASATKLSADRTTLTIVGGMRLMKDDEITLEFVGLSPEAGD